MTFEEFAKVSAALQEAYPREKILQTQTAIEFWFRQLQDIPYQDMVLAVNTWVETSRWSPTIADLREKAAEVRLGDVPDWSEAWERVLYVIRRYGPYRQQEAMAALDETTRTVVRRLGFMALCASENTAADRANFRQIYSTLADRTRKHDQLSGPVRRALEEAGRFRPGIGPGYNTHRADTSSGMIETV